MPDVLTVAVKLPSAKLACSLYILMELAGQCLLHYVTNHGSLFSF